MAPTFGAFCTLPPSAGTVATTLSNNAVKSGLQYCLHAKFASRHGSHVRMRGARGDVFLLVVKPHLCSVVVGPGHAM